MEDKKLFMVDANQIVFCGSNMGRCISIYFNEGLGKYGDGVTRKIPFMRTNENECEYVELITGTHYYYIHREFVTADRLVFFMDFNIEDYSDKKLAQTFEGHSLFGVKSAMKFGYKENKKNIRDAKKGKVEKGAKILSKLKRKQGLK